MFYRLLSFLAVVTDLGDAAVTGVFSLIFAGYLFAQREKRAAFAILTAFVVAALAIGLSKIALYSRCEPSAFPLSPSGHSAIAIAVYGTAALIIGQSLPRVSQRVAAYALTALMLAFLVVSRHLLGYHRVSDVIVGSGIGIATLLGVWLVFLKGRVARCRWWPFAVMGVIAVGFLYGAHVPAEDMIDRISTFLRDHFHFC